MKKVAILLMCLLAISLAGCSDVQMSPLYRVETERMNNRLVELNNRCQAGDAEACKEGLRIATVHVERIVDAMHGRESD